MKIMNKLQNRKEELKKNNKGFSLVELIIVIAIMAILVGIVGTQVVPYIEKSRKAKDTQILSGFCTDAMTAYSSNAAALDATKTYKITITRAAAGTMTVATTGGTDVENNALNAAFLELNTVDTSAPKFESKAGKGISKIEISCKNAAPMVSEEITTSQGSFDKIESN